MFSWLKNVFGDFGSKAVDIGKSLVNGAGRAINDGLESAGWISKEQRDTGKNVLDKIDNGLDIAKEVIPKVRSAIDFAEDVKNKL